MAFCLDPLLGRYSNFCMVGWRVKQRRSFFPTIHAGLAAGGLDTFWSPSAFWWPQCRSGSSRQPWLVSLNVTRYRVKTESRRAPAPERRPSAESCGNTLKVDRTLFWSSADILLSYVLHKAGEVFLTFALDNRKDIHWSYTKVDLI